MEALPCEEGTIGVELTVELKPRSRQTPPPVGEKKCNDRCVHEIIVNKSEVEVEVGSCPSSMVRNTCRAGGS